MKKTNLVLFPNVDKQLVEKGLAFMQEKKFKEALTIFEELETLQLSNDSSKFAVIVCLYELGEYENALTLAEELVEKHDYQDFQIAQFYMTILVQLNQYEKLEKVAKILENQTFLTEEMKDQLRSLQNFSKKANSVKADRFDRDWEALLFRNASVEHVLMNLQEMSYEEYIDHQQTFHFFLSEENTSYLLKTFILEKLKELRSDETLKVQKFSQNYLFNPVENPSLFETDFYVQVYNCLENVLGNENPSLFQIVKEYVDQVFMVYYPIMPPIHEAISYAAAIHVIGYSFQGMDISTEEIMEQYGVLGDILEEKIEEIKKIERKYILPL